jgi:hypothetical protein
MWEEERDETGIQNVIVFITQLDSTKHSYNIVNGGGNGYSIGTCIKC